MRSCHDLPSTIFFGGSDAISRRPFGSAIHGWLIFYLVKPDVDDVALLSVVICGQRCSEKKRCVDKKRHQRTSKNERKYRGMQRRTRPQGLSVVPSVNCRLERIKDVQMPPPAPFQRRRRPCAFSAAPSSRPTYGQRKHRITKGDAGT